MFLPKSYQRFAGNDVHKEIISRFEIRNKTPFAILLCADYPQSASHYSLSINKGPLLTKPLIVSRSPNSGGMYSIHQVMPSAASDRIYSRSSSRSGRLALPPMAISYPCKEPRCYRMKSRNAQYRQVSELEGLRIRGKPSDLSQVLGDIPVILFGICKSEISCHTLTCLSEQIAHHKQ